MTDTQTKRDAFIFDIDGTLADHKGIRGPFDEHLVHLDRPVDAVFKVLKALVADDYKIIFVSGRTDECREETLQWLYSHLPGWKLKYHGTIDLYMRKQWDRRKDCIVKKEIYDAEILPFYNIIGVFDDRLQVCRMLYDEGIFCFNVNQGLKEF